MANRSGASRGGEYEYRMRWDNVVYQPGELKVVTYKNGKEWATDTVRTAAPPAKLALSADRSTVRADGTDLAFITVRVLDAAGITAPAASDHIKFTTDGPGEIVATDNGDPTSFEPFQAPERNAFNGQALVVVRAFAGRPGTIRISAQSGTLESASVTLKRNFGKRFATRKDQPHAPPM
jgi:beta-galactosidase